jgi:hypothetical protein
MSKCDITIEFDRADYVYRGGDTVSGTARVVVNKNMTSRGIKFSHFWKTHGRGNTNTGEVQEEMLAQDAQLVAGETFSFPFSFESEKEPITYRGNYINIDHYVKIQVDVPWARDPKLEAEYILLPGVPPRLESDLEEEPEEGSQSMPWYAWLIVGRLVMFLLTTTLILALIACLPLILPFYLPFYIYGKLKAKAIAKRLGEVELETAEQTLAPGGTWKTRLRFTPKRDVRINGIRARLKVNEVAISGSGTNQTTHIHSVHDETITIEPEGVLAVGKPFDQVIEVPLPETRVLNNGTTAYSFHSGSNNINWSTEIRIDLPGIPDWKEEEHFEVIPVEFLDPASAKPISPGQQPAAAPVASPAAAPVPTASAPATAAPASPAAVAPIPTPVTPASPILALVSQLADPSNTGSERTQLIESMQGKSFPVTVDVERSVSTFTSNDGDQYKNGYTITGVIAGSQQAVELFTLNERSAEVRDLRRGDSWSTSVSVSRWDTLYNRLVLLQTG